MYFNSIIKIFWESYVSRTVCAMLNLTVTKGGSIVWKSLAGIFFGVPGPV